MSIRLISKNFLETFEIGKRIANNEIIDIETKRVFFLKGELGSGKTSFVRGFCSKWGLQDDVSSPSFTIVNEYTADKIKIIHIDLYRLKSSDEIDDIGFFDICKNADYVFIEWPEILEKNFMMDRYTIKFSYGNSLTERIILVE